ncbi:MAG: KEOPS complex subunit Pcc1 [Promethearchaeota archaeon]
MSKNNYISVKSTIELLFKNPQMRDISYTSFLPEFNKLQTKRSNIVMEKKNDKSLIFKIQSNDITAFRASINEIISFGKVVSNSFEIVDNS